MEKKAKGVIYRVRAHKLNRIAVSLEVSFTLYLNHSRERGPRLRRWHTRGRTKVFVGAPLRGRGITPRPAILELKLMIRSGGLRGSFVSRIILAEKCEKIITGIRVRWTRWTRRLYPRFRCDVTAGQNRSRSGCP